MEPRGNERGRPSWPTSYNPALAAAIIVGGLFVFWAMSSEPAGLRLAYGDFKQILQAPGVQFDLLTNRDEIRGRILTQDRLTGLTADERKAYDANGGRQSFAFATSRRGLEFDDSLQEHLDSPGVRYEGAIEDPALAIFLSMLPILLMVLLLVGVSVAMHRWMGGEGSPFSFGRSRHKVYQETDTHTTFADVAGIDEAVAELREVVDFLKRPEKYRALGGRIPKGVLLVGPPGTGKTLLAKAVAGEAGVPFFSLSGSDFVEMFVGVGASRVRDLFREAEAKAPCIVFIDELDALGKSRGNSMVASHDEREQTLNQLLVELDGFDSNRGVILVGATNRPETLDAALLRPGRFDRTVVVDRPDIEGREAILKVHARDVRLADHVNLRRIAALTPGSVGADLANLINEAALLAARADKDKVEMNDLVEAVERGAVGLERRSRIMRADEKRRVAYHEAGHALVAVACPNTDPVQKVSIVPRGPGALGYVLQRPDDDRHLMTQGELEDRIRVALGGTIAEELIFGEISNGATSDLNQANMIARRMVKEFGMSRLGRLFLRDGEGMSYLPGMGESHGDASPDTAREVDLEVRRIINACLQDVRGILQRGLPALTAVAERLIDKEVIDGSDLQTLLRDHHFPPSAQEPDSCPPSA
jgi:cell division protease FtsH